MDKGRRHQIKMLKLKKRLKQLNLTNTNGNFYAYRSHGSPCSCFMCSPYKYKRHKLRIRTTEELKACHVDGYEYLI